MSRKDRPELNCTEFPATPYERDVGDFGAKYRETASATKNSVRCTARDQARATHEQVQARLGSLTSGGTP